ncbi:hypothetical protein PRIPAC_77493 [Pristionchus pacificus]|uniref:Uncharacterized protein n=1 Tax=Pristionchus pacificus TaxID=54126 RepID=A0A454Y4Q8_PRIPA|nr:hypothetical protein PRIPAC_77493 [Pristionchus pacificus]|eukprot:PDM79230.1 hypothetical protein PRIPAC_31809 [Pristionchus pacificus]
MFTTLFLACLLVSALAGPAESNAIGACVSGKCPEGFHCVDESCVGQRIKRATECEKSSIAGGKEFIPY